MILADGSIRRGTMEDVIAASKLCQMMDELEHWGPLVYPTDVEPDNVYLAAWQAMWRSTPSWSDTGPVKVCRPPVGRSAVDSR